MTIWEQVDAFEQEVRSVVGRYHEEFDIPVSCIEGILVQVGREFSQEKNINFESDIPLEDEDEDDFLGVG